jgi:hypothetical protein
MLMELKKCGWLQDDRGSDKPTGPNEQGTNAGENPIEGAKVWGTTSRPIKDQQLVLEQDGFGQDRAQTSMSSESCDDRNEMNKEEDNIEHSASYQTRTLSDYGSN